MHVNEAREKLGTQFHWLCDTMRNDLKHAFGDRPNSEFIIDPKGKILVARQWSNPAALREDLERLIGTVDRPTQISQLNLPEIERPQTAAKGVVPRIKLPGPMTPVKVAPLDQNETYYAKLRAEVEPDYFRSGAGQLYLGFFLDPLHKVHWNNKAAPVTFEISDIKGFRVSETQGRGPDVEAAADADPREFLVELEAPASEGSEAPELRITVRYFACDDAETFCMLVTQNYLITLERDADGGSRRASGGRGARGRRPSGQPRLPFNRRRGPYGERRPGRRFPLRGNQ